MHCLPAKAGSSGAAVESTPGDTFQGTEAEFVSIHLCSATQDLLPFGHTHEQCGHAVAVISAHLLSSRQLVQEQK